MALFGRFTERAQKALTYAQQAAVELKHHYIGTEHLLLGLLKEPGEPIRSLLGNVTYETVMERVIALVGRGGEEVSGSLEPTPRGKKILEASLIESRHLNHTFVGTEHFWLAILREGEGVAYNILREMEVDADKLREGILSLLKSEETDGEKEGKPAAASSAASDTPVLKQYGRDLTQAARNGELDPVIGRSREIERIVQILSRRTKNNPVLIGEPGVGKSAVVEGLAQRIVNDSIPEILKDKKVMTLELGSLIAGSK